MNTDQQKKFANHIIEKVNKENKPYQHASKNSITKQFTILLIGIFFLLIGCILLFDGAMVPAMWQLTSILWICYYFSKIIKE